MIHGISQQLREDNLLKRGCFGVQVSDDDAAMSGCYEPQNKATVATSGAT